MYFEQRLNWYIHMKFILFIIGVLSCSLVFATKPCPAAPCNDINGEFNEELCIEKSEWIAIGRVGKVIDVVVGLPMNKNFAEFVFLVDEWKVNPQKYPSKMIFKVGWCLNQQELPEKREGQYIFYGGTTGEYYAFKRLE